jgi:hypothetical protein
MKSIVITKDCFCEGYLHEKMNYPRAGLVEKKLAKGDVLNVIEEWSNMYGRYYSAEKDGIKYDVAILNARYN